MKLELSERGLVARINRKLSKDGLRLRGCHPARRDHNDVGDFYVVDKKNVIDRRVDLERYGRKLGVLREYERVVP